MNNATWRLWGALAGATVLSAHAAAQSRGSSIDDLRGAQGAGQVTAVALTTRFERNIAAGDRSGPALHTVIVLNPHALFDAKALDAERAAGHLRGPLHGVPILLKDNIESADDTATTAGSLALKDNVTGRDAPLVKRLTDAGAVILGKTNLSEWANFRSNHASSGWSAVGGQTLNPYDIRRSPCGCYLVTRIDTVVIQHALRCP